MKKQVFFSVQQTNSVKLIGLDPEPTDYSASCRQPINGNERFTCENPACSQSCEVCKGVGYLTGNNNFVRFIEAIVEFKLGGTANPDRDIFPAIMKQSQLRFSSMVMGCSREWQKQPPPGRKSMVPLRNSYQQQASMELHHGIECDGCHQYPIQGLRFQCLSCPDYDLCECCYKMQVHQHQNFMSVPKSKRESNKQRLRNWAVKEQSIASNRLSSIIMKLGQLSS